MLNFATKTNEGMVVLIDRATMPTWVLITDETQKAVLKRYIETSVASDNRDIIAAMSDMKDFMCHLMHPVHCL